MAWDEWMFIEELYILVAVFWSTLNSSVYLTNVSSNHVLLKRAVLIQPNVQLYFYDLVTFNNHPSYYWQIYHKAVNYWGCLFRKWTVAWGRKLSRRNTRENVRGRWDLGFTRLRSTCDSAAERRAFIEIITDLFSKLLWHVDQWSECVSCKMLMPLECHDIQDMKGYFSLMRSVKSIVKLHHPGI